MDPTSITPAFVSGLRKQLRSRREQIKRLQAEADAYERMLADARIVAPLAFDDEGVSEVEEWAGDDGPDGAKPTMPQAILTILGERSLSKLDLRSRLAERYPSIKLGDNGVYFYRTVRRMEKSGRLKKKGQKLVIP